MATVLRGRGGAAIVASEERRPPVERLALNALELSEEARTNIYVQADTLFNVVDRDGDESISAEELTEYLLLARYDERSVEALFALIDVNSDGKLTRGEIRDAFVTHPSLRGAPGMGSLPKSKRAAVHEEADATFDAADLNSDGRLTLPELQKFFESREGPSYSAAAVARIFFTLSPSHRALVARGARLPPYDESAAVTRTEFRESYVRYRAMRLALCRNKGGEPCPDAP